MAFRDCGMILLAVQGDIPHQGISFYQTTPHSLNLVLHVINV